jgi:hypothetical protein
VTANRHQLRYKATRTLVRVALCATAGATAAVVCTPTVSSGPTDAYAVTTTIVSTG